MPGIYVPAPYADLLNCLKPTYPRLCAPTQPTPVRALCCAGQGTLVRTGPEPDDYTIIDSAKTPRVTRPTKAQKKAYRKNATFLKLHPVG